MVRVGSSGKKGFTLLELVIVLGILAVLALTVILVLNPVKIFQEARDTQRIADVGQMTKALNVYVATSSNVDLGKCGSASNDNSNGTYGNATLLPKCYIQPLDLHGNSATDTNPANNMIRCGKRVGVGNGTPSYPATTMNAGTQIDGTGWMPVNLTTGSIGKSLSSWPVDPLSVANYAGSVFNRDSSYYYSYYCDINGMWEFQANMESARYGSGGADDVETLDGGGTAGVNTNWYEAGTNLQL